MSRPTNHTKADISTAWVSAIVTKAGFVARPASSGGDYGVDIEAVDIVQSGTKYIQGDALLHLQIKCTWVFKKDGSDLVYRLSVDDITRLRKSKRLARTLLVVCCVPMDESVWIRCTEESLILKEAAFYIDARDIPIPDTKKNKTFRIPRAQLLTPEAVAKMADEERRKHEQMLLSLVKESGK